MLPLNRVRYFCAVSLILTFGGVAGAKGPVADLPESFYARPGLEGMLRIRYASLPVVNVKDLGALGDGHQEARPFFQKALDQLVQRGGGILYVPRGTYVFSQSGQVFWELGKNKDGSYTPLKNLHIVGEGEGSIIRFDLAAPGRTGWEFGPSDNVSLRDLSFSLFPFSDGTGAQDLAFGINLIRFCTYGPDSPIYARHIQIVRVHTDHGRVPIWIQRYARDVWVVDCTVRNSNRDGIHFDGVMGGVAAYNRVESCGDDGLACIADATVGMLPAMNVSFLYNTVYNSRVARGITLGGTNNRVIGNWVERVGVSGLYFNWGHGGNGHPILNAEVRDNTVVRTDLADRWSPGLWDMYGGAIRVTSKTAGLVIENNRIYGGDGDGILFGRGAPPQYEPLAPWAANVVCVGNDLQGNRGYGLRFDPRICADNVILRGNRTLGNDNGTIRIETRVEDLHQSGNVEKGTPVYKDAYRSIRLARDEKGWVEPARVTPEGSAVVVSVADCGAKGDGLADDTAAFYRALEKLPAPGGVIRVPAGTYRLRPIEDRQTAPFTCVRHHVLIADRSNVHLEGVPGKSTLAFESPDHQGIRFVNVRHGSVRHLMLKLQVQPPLRHDRALLDLSGCQDMAVEDVTASGSSGPGLLIDACRGVRIDNCTVQDAGTSGIELLASRQVRVQGCRLVNSRDHGIYCSYEGSIMREPQYVRLTGNTIQGTREGYGLYIAKGNAINIEKNQVTDTYQAGICFTEAGPWFLLGEVSVRNNVLARCNNGPLANTQGVISVLGHRAGARLLLTGNRIEDTAHAGVWLCASLVDKLRLQNNTMRNVKEGPVKMDQAQKPVIKDLVVE